MIFDHFRCPIKPKPSTCLEGLSNLFRAHGEDRSVVHLGIRERTCLKTMVLVMVIEPSRPPPRSSSASS